jgi:geranylgeranyl diphosphate synthase type II
MGNELFDEINPDAYHAAIAIELFHNFTLIHDDIMDKAPLRRGLPTVHEKFGKSTALLGGDVMLVVAYEYLNKIQPHYLPHLLSAFNKMAVQVCEGQQLDMDFEKKEKVNFEEYLHMITLKTSVALAVSLKIGALLGNAELANQNHLFEFGKNLGIAFQLQDDYLDAFGDPSKFGKQTGGDILANKKTFLLIHAIEVANSYQLEEIKNLMQNNSPDKIEKVLHLFKQCNVDEWARTLKEKYLQTALNHLDEIAIASSRKQPLRELAEYLIEREN